MQIEGVPGFTCAWEQRLRLQRLQHCEWIVAENMQIVPNSMPHTECSTYEEIGLDASNRLYHVWGNRHIVYDIMEACRGIYKHAHTIPCKLIFTGATDTSLKGRSSYSLIIALVLNWHVRRMKLLNQRRNWKKEIRTPCKEGSRNEQLKRKQVE